jgi:hypothetical protein
MDRRIDMPWVGAKHHGEWDQNTIGRGFDLLYEEWSKYLGNTMDRGFDIPMVGQSIYHG